MTMVLHKICGRAWNWMQTSYSSFMKATLVLQSRWVDAYINISIHTDVRHDTNFGLLKGGGKYKPAKKVHAGLEESQPFFSGNSHKSISSHVRWICIPTCFSAPWREPGPSLREWGASCVNLPAVEAIGRGAIGPFLVCSQIMLWET